jgi:hypothetical protein
MKPMNAEVVTTMNTSFLKRLVYKNGLNPERVFRRRDIILLRLKKFIGIVQVSSETREIKEYDVQPKTEEDFSLSYLPCNH